MSSVCCGAAVQRSAAGRCVALVAPRRLEARECVVSESITRQGCVNHKEGFHVFPGGVTAVRGSCSHRSWPVLRRASSTSIDAAFAIFSSKIANKSSIGFPKDANKSVLRLASTRSGRLAAATRWPLGRVHTPAGYLGGRAICDGAVAPARARVQRRGGIEGACGGAIIVERAACPRR